MSPPAVGSLSPLLTPRPLRRAGPLCVAEAPPALARASAAPATPRLLTAPGRLPSGVRRKGPSLDPWVPIQSP